MIDIGHPEVHIQLTGEDGNPFAVLGRVRRALQSAGGAGRGLGVMEEATGGDYDNLLQTVMRWVGVS